ncbi:hypothetical protein QL285_090698 [Trifolium repens]|nr:hypothetical protein QL285_090698 [Trifolium repens]
MYFCSSSTIMAGLNFSEIIFHNKVQKLTYLTRTLIPLFSLFLYCLFTVFTVARAIYGRNYFLFNLIVVTLNAALGIITSVMLDNWIANIGYPIVGLMSIMVLFLSCSKRVTKIFLSVDEFGTHGVHGGEGQETEGQENEGSGEGQETEGSAEVESDDEGEGDDD